MTRSYRLELTPSRPLAAGEDAPHLYFTEPKAWQVSLRRQISRDVWDGPIRKLERKKTELAVQLKRAGIRIDFETGDGRYVRRVEDGEESIDLDEGAIIAQEHADTITEIFELSIERDFDLALVMISHVKGLHLIDEEFSRDAEWPTLSRRDSGPSMDARRDAASLLDHADKIRVIDTYRRLQARGIEGLTESERDDLKKSSPSEQA